VLRAKQEILMNLVSAYLIGGSAEIPCPSKFAELNEMAEAIVRSEDEADPRVKFGPETSLAELHLSARARTALLEIAKLALITDKWGLLGCYTVSAFEQYIDEKTLEGLPNVGIGTIKSIKYQFGLCGIQIRSTCP